MAPPAPALHRWSFCLVFAALASLATAQGRVFVPGQFAEIGTAIQSVTPGTIIDVQWQARPYLPFVVDRPVTIVGHAGEQQAPMVEVSQGVGIAFQLAAGERATVCRIDVVPAVGATLFEAVRIQGGSVTLEDCRFRGGRDSTGSAGLATVDVVDAEVTMSFTRIEGGRGVIGLRALRSAIAATKVRFFGSTVPAGDAVQLDDSVLHAADCLLWGGEDFRTGPGARGLHATGSARAFLVDCAVTGGMGRPGGIGLVNATTTPVELLRTGVGGGRDLNTNRTVAASTGPVLTNPGLLGLGWSEPPYRRGTLQLGLAFGVQALAAPGTTILLLVSFDPRSTTTTWTRQPAVALQDIALVAPVVAGAAGYASFSATVPNVPALTGVGLWIQAVAGATLPLEASPLSGVVVR